MLKTQINLKIQMLYIIIKRLIFFSFKIMIKDEVKKQDLINVGFIGRPNTKLNFRDYN
jgi:hypothetical protein